MSDRCDEVDWVVTFEHPELLIEIPERFGFACQNGIRGCRFGLHIQSEQGLEKADIALVDCRYERICTGLQNSGFRRNDNVFLLSVSSNGSIIL